MARAAVVTTPAAWRDLRAAAQPGASAGLVPTMGGLHEGHLSLIRRAAAENDLVVVSVFVNPMQFGDPADLENYPRSLDRDLDLASDAGASVVYAPAVETIYPAGFATSVHVSGVTERWEGESRPGHFDGVATVVTILLNQIRPDRAYFGEKDWQQLVLIRGMHTDLALPGTIVACPTVREADGLAMSSRNSRLSDKERAAATVLWRALTAMREMTGTGEADALKLALMGAIIIRREPAVTLDYLQVVDPETLEPVDIVRPGSRAIVAAMVGSTRLIDTMALHLDEVQ
ncbi:MAG: pantoate--beta-alanine ligase [Chloroflexota bacterium]|nr:pantoate--beta-alanine ligase [Chloroflexota bacterium]